MRFDRRRTFQAGFTLIELMIVVAVVALLARLAYSSYISSVQKGNRADAKDALLTASQILERCYSQYYSYTNAACPAIQTTSANKYYTITTAFPNGGYTITATAASGIQLSDSKCASFSLDQQGNQKALNSGGADNTTYCWTGHN